jgi:hypothetical protein
MRRHHPTGTSLLLSANNTPALCDATIANPITDPSTDPVQSL